MSKGLRSSAGIFHDTIIYFCCRWGESQGFQAESEAKGECTNDKFRPDVVLRQHKDKHRHSVVYIEVQKRIDKAWLKKCQENYEGKCLVIIDLDNLIYSVETEIMFSDTVVKTLYGVLSEQLDMETLAPERKPKRERVARPCVSCEKPLKNLYRGLCRSCLNNPRVIQ